MINKKFKNGMPYRLKIITVSGSVVTSKNAINLVKTQLHVAMFLDKIKRYNSHGKETV